MKILSLILLLVPIFSISPENITNITKNTILSDVRLQNQEHIFEYYGILPFIIFTLGCFIILYGAYYNYFLIMKVTLFLYYIISIFISFKEDTIRRDLLFILLFSFISGVLIYIIYKSQIKFFESHIYIKKIVYGAITGCFLNQIIFHFIYSFENKLENTSYFISFPILILLFALVNIPIPDKIAFIPCSVVTGLFFIQSGIDNLFYALEISGAEKILDIIFLVIISILAFFYQIYHLNRKKEEVPGLLQKVKTNVRKNLDITQDEQEVSPNTTTELMEKNNRDLNKTNDEVNETQDNQIDDQDD
jgi:cell division protein FtsL